MVHQSWEFMPDAQIFLCLSLESEFFLSENDPWSVPMQQLAMDSEVLVFYPLTTVSHLSPEVSGCVHLKVDRWIHPKSPLL